MINPSHLSVAQQHPTTTTIAAPSNISLPKEGCSSKETITAIALQNLQVSAEIFTPIRTLLHKANFDSPAIELDPGDTGPAIVNGPIEQARRKQFLEKLQNRKEQHLAFEKESQDTPLIADNLLENLMAYAEYVEGLTSPEARDWLKENKVEIKALPDYSDLDFHKVIASDSEMKRSIVKFNHQTRLAMEKEGGLAPDEFNILVDHLILLIDEIRKRHR